MGQTASRLTFTKDSRGCGFYYAQTWRNTGLKRLIRLRKWNSSPISPRVPGGFKVQYVPTHSMPTSTTVEIDEQGRLTVPKPVREALEIEGTEALVELEIDVKKRKEATE